MKLKRYLFALLLIAGMVAAAELTGETEVIFPEIAALVVGMWVVDKPVWRVRRRQLVVLMTLGAVVGISLVRFSPFPLVVNMVAAFVFSAVCLMFCRATLVPLISACMLPVLLGAESWVYPLAVLVMTLIITSGQVAMERSGLRHTAIHVPADRDWRRDVLKWGTLLAILLLLVALPVWSGYTYFILPPLIVTFVEFSNPKAGFRRAPLLVFFLLSCAAVLGAGLQLFLHVKLGVPAYIVAVLICGVLFALSEWRGRLFAPAGAVALIPMIIPAADLVWFPLQAMSGAAVFIGIPMLLFQRDIVWHEPRRIGCVFVRLFRTVRRSA